MINSIIDMAADVPVPYVATLSTAVGLASR